MNASAGRRVAAEFVGTLLLLATIVGSGIMGERLSGGNDALALLANALATGAMLCALILAFGAVSGAHFNPLVTLGEALRRALAWRAVPGYVAAQLAGAFAGVATAHAMFGAPLFSASTHARAGAAQGFSEFVATFGLVLIVRGVASARRAAVPFAVAAYITAAYWFTASTSFANPAVTLARSATDTFSGIRPADTPLFLVAQLVGAAAAAALASWLWPARAEPSRVAESGSASRSRSAPGAAAMPSVATVLFACIHNAGRSQMAAAFFDVLADPTRARALSAGTRPAAHVHPLVVEAMREVGIELGGVRPRLLTPELASGARLLVTLGCAEECPLVPGLERRDWPLADPAGQSLERVRAIREDVLLRVRALVEEHGWQRSSRAASAV